MLLLQAQKRRLTNLEAEMNAFQSNDLQRLKYYSTVLRKPTDGNLVSVILNISSILFL